jgi:hypothetical protein
MIDFREIKFFFSSEKRRQNGAMKKQDWRSL